MNQSEQRDSGVHGYRRGGGGPAYLTVGAVDEGPLAQQVLQGPRQVLGEGGHGENLRHPARHVRHGLVGEAHLQSLVAPLQPAGAGGWGRCIL